MKEVKFVLWTLAVVALTSLWWIVILKGNVAPNDPRRLIDVAAVLFTVIPAAAGVAYLVKHWKDS